MCLLFISNNDTGHHQTVRKEEIEKCVLKKFKGISFTSTRAVSANICDFDTFVFRVAYSTGLKHSLVPFGESPVSKD